LEHHLQQLMDFLQLFGGPPGWAIAPFGALEGLTNLAIMPFVRQFVATDREWFAGQPIHRSVAGGILASPLSKTVM
jgi:hypothetical protein